MRRLAILILLAGGIAHADPQSDQLFDEGRKLLDAGDAKGACEKFDKAISIDPTAAGTMLNLGLCNEKLGKYATALHWFRRAQTAAAEATPRLTQHEQVAKDHTQTLAAKVATISITFGSGDPPADTKVKIDRADLQKEEYGRAEVDPGHHVLDAAAPNMKNVHQEFDVADKPGAGPTLAIAFTPGSNAITIDRGAGRRKVAIAIAIGGGVLWLASAGVGLYANNQYCSHVVGVDMMGNPESCSLFSHPSNPMPKNGMPSDTQAGNDAISLAKWGGTGLFIAGAAAIGIASYIYFTAPQPEKLEQTVLLPVIDRNGGGIALTGRF